jgi:hypothetical protein
MSIGPGHPLHRNLETIFQKVPPELRERMNRRQLPDDTPTEAPSDKALVRLHKQVIDVHNFDLFAVVKNISCFPSFSWSC